MIELGQYENRNWFKGEEKMAVTIATKQQCEMIDYFLSFSLVVEDFEENRYPFIDQEEEEIVKEYRAQLEKRRKTIEKYCLKEYNLLFGLYLLNKKEFQTLEQLEQQLEEMDQKEWKDAIFSILGLEKEGEEEFEAINSLHILDKQKWNLFSIIKDKKKSLLEIKALFQELYPLFSYYEEKLMKKNKERAEEIQSSIEEKTREYYEDVLEDKVEIDEKYLEESIHYILFMSRFSIVISDAEEKKRLVTGVHVQEVKHYKKENQRLGEEEKEKVLKALSDPNRFSILKMLKEGKLSNKEMAERLKITPAGVTYQMNHLVGVGLVRYCTKENGRGKNYIVNVSYLEKVFESILKELA